jgi:hypothetical protein
MMVDEKNYEVVKGLWIGSKFGDLRRERAALMKKLIQNNDVSVKPKIRELTQEIYEYLLQQRSDEK